MRCSSDRAHARIPIILILLAAVGITVLPVYAATGSRTASAVAPVSGFTTTSAEKEWLRNNPHPLRVAILRDNMPFENYGGGMFEGIAVDYLNIVAASISDTFRRNVSFTGYSWTELLNAANEDKVDIFPVDVLNSTAGNGERILTVPYMTERLVIAGLESSGIDSLASLNGKTIAIMMNLAGEKEIGRDFPDSKYHLVGSVAEALQSLTERKAAVYIGSLPAINYARHKYAFHHIDIICATPYEIKKCFSIRKDWPELAEMFNRAIALIPETTQRQIYRKWTDIPSESPRTAIFRLTYGKIVASGVALLILAALLILLWTRRLGRETVERKLAEGKLKNSLLLLETIFDTIPGPVFYVGINGDFIGGNRAFCDDIIGMNKELMLGMNIFEIISRHNSDKVTFIQRKTSELIQNSGVQIYDLEFVCADGNIRDFSVYSATFKQNGREAGIISIMLDISEKKKIEKELLLAKNAAEAATDAKSNFVANMSHELRTPLNAVIGITHLIMQTELNEKQLSYLQKVDTASRHLLGVINDILDFSKIEAGKMSMEMIDFSIGTIFRELRDMFSAKAREKNLTLDFAIHQAVPLSLRGDPLRLKQILINLVSNAVKFTNTGGIKVSAECGRRRGNRQVLKFCIADSGIGISAEQLENLFAPFNQADNSMTRKFGGTGLGLVITKRLIELMNGKLEVKSTVDVGSSFMFDVELETGRTADEATDTSTVIAVNKMTLKSKNIDKLEKIRGARILLVEDNSINRQVAIEMLSQVGMVVDSAENGQEAVDMITGAEHKYDAVFMDVQMPIMDGYKATETIRASGCDTPIIALTAHVMPAAIKRCLQSGMNDHLNKPLNPELMYSSLLKWVKPGARDYIPLTPKPRETGTVEMCDMPGLNITRALEPIDGDTVLMKQLLDTFRKDFGHEGDNILRALDMQDWNYLKHSFHKLKGSASYIGAENIRSSAASLEDKLTNEIPLVREEVDILIYHIAQVVDSIAILIGKPTIAH